MDNFLSLGLNDQLLDNIEVIGFEKPTSVQEQVIPLFLAGEDIFVQSQTGSGKTAAFALPILNNIQAGQKDVQCLVVSPTRELAIQVGDAFRELGQNMGFSVLAVFGGQSYDRQTSRLKKGVDIVVGTPGRMLDLIRKQILDLSHVKVVVLDEADEMLSMGFIDDMHDILDSVPEERQTGLFSATLPHQIKELAQKFMHDAHSIMIKRQHMTVDSIEQRYYLVDKKQKIAAITRLFEIENITKALVFAATKISTEQLAGELSARGFQAEVINGNFEQAARIRTINRFRKGKIKVLVATDVAARGLDIDGISHVFNYDLPRDAEIYVHRIGRTGRAGNTGIALTFVTPKEAWQLKRVEKYTRKEILKGEIPTEEEIILKRENDLLERMRVWLNRGRCSKEKELISDLVDEGFDPIEIAAVGLKMARADEKQRPIEAFTPVSATGKGGKKNKRKSNASRYKKHANEEGMVRILIDSGKKNGINPSEIVGSITRFSNIPGNSIGKIVIKDKHTLVDIDAKHVGKVMEKTGQIRMKKNQVNFSLAK